MHSLIVTDFEDGEPIFTFDHGDGTGCAGWEECSLEHEVDGVSAASGPFDGDDEALPWEDEEDFEFHGQMHSWRYGFGWTIPYEGCVLQGADFELPRDELQLLGVGTWPIVEEWDETNVSIEIGYFGFEVEHLLGIISSTQGLHRDIARTGFARGNTEVLRALSGSLDTMVRLEVAQHKNTHLSVIDNLLRDSDARVNAAAKERLTEFAQGLGIEADNAAAIDMIIKMGACWWEWTPNSQEVDLILAVARNA